VPGPPFGEADGQLLQWLYIPGLALIALYGKFLAAHSAQHFRLAQDRCADGN